MTVARVLATLAVGMQLVLKQSIWLGGILSGQVRPGRWSFQMVLLHRVLIQYSRSSLSLIVFHAFQYARIFNRVLYLHLSLLHLKLGLDLRPLLSLMGCSSKSSPLRRKREYPKIGGFWMSGQTAAAVALC